MISGGIASGGDTNKERRGYLREQHTSTIMNVEPMRKRPRDGEIISFSEKDQGTVQGPHDDAIVLSLKINAHRVKRILIDTGSSADILYLPAFKLMGYDIKNLRKIQTPLIGFTGDSLQPEGLIQMRVEFGTASRVTSVMTDFLVVDAPSAYNAILGRSTLNAIGAIISPSHLKLKFHTDEGIGEECGHQQTSRDCYLVSIKGKGGLVHQVERKHHKDLEAVIKEVIEMKMGEEVALDPKDKVELANHLEPVDEIEEIDIGNGKTLNIGKAIQGQAREELVTFLRQNKSVFAWTPADMPGIPRTIAEHESLIL